MEDQRRAEQAKSQKIDKQIEEKAMLLLQKRLEEHYSLMMNFIRTKAEPTIFYLPSEHNPQTERRLEETRSAIRQKLESLKDHIREEVKDAGDASPRRASSTPTRRGGREEGRNDGGQVN